ncbi:hypothetical protein EDE11_108152 [Methylomonas methanica]|uniref:Uncharacterized protein n=1 Tax=Methylomonas methanica TaxID=421 RepID=A0ABY2CMD8_METMH|nr:hypothetical protein EDE11_108152 [Methylomonas methanica]
MSSTMYTVTLPPRLLALAPKNYTARSVKDLLLNDSPQGHRNGVYDLHKTEKITLASIRDI